MSVMEADEQDGATVLHYAPRHLRAPEDERSIRPILERLNRGGTDAPADPQPAARVHVPIELDPPRKGLGWQMIACSALSAGFSAGLAVLAIGWFAPSKTEPTRIDAIQLDPKFVHTVSFKQDAPAAAPNDLQKQAPEAAPPIQPKDAPPPSKAEAHDNQIAPKELLALWSAIPADVLREPAAEETTSVPAQTEEPARAEAEMPPVREGSHRSAPENRHYTQARHRHRFARAHATRGQASARSAAPAAETAGGTPLQSAFQSLFGQSASAQAKQPQAGMSGY
jgi:hypothetical protein